MTCAKCKQENDHSLFWIRRGSYDQDPFFGLPLALKSDLADGTLCAYNSAHAKALHDFVAADLRVRGEYPLRRTLLTILPAWIKSAKNRDVVARGYWRLYEKGLALEGKSETA